MQQMSEKRSECLKLRQNRSMFVGSVVKIIAAYVLTQNLSGFVSVQLSKLTVIDGEMRHINNTVIPKTVISDNC